MCRLSCVFSAVKAGEAAAEEREDALQGPLRVGPGEGPPTFQTGPQRQQWSRRRRVVREGVLGEQGEGAQTGNIPYVMLATVSVL